MLRNQTRSAPTSRNGCRGLQERRWGSGGGGDEAGNRRGKEGQEEGKDNKVPLNSRASQVQSCNGGVLLIISEGCVNRETSGDTIRANIPELTFTGGRDAGKGKA